MKNLYLIYPLRNSYPEVYRDIETALKEAKKMARLNPGQEFYVMSAIATVEIATPVEITEIASEAIKK